MYIVHCLTVKLSAVFRRGRAAGRETPVVALAIVELMIDVPVEMIRPVVPRASADDGLRGIADIFVVGVGSKCRRRITGTTRFWWR